MRIYCLFLYFFFFFYIMLTMLTNSYKPHRLAIFPSTLCVNILIFFVDIVDFHIFPHVDNFKRMLTTFQANVDTDFSFKSSLPTIFSTKSL